MGYPMNHETCTEAMERIEREKPRVQITIDERVQDLEQIYEWIYAFFEHPERVLVKRFEVHR